MFIATHSMCGIHLKKEDFFMKNWKAVKNTLLARRRSLVTDVWPILRNMMRNVRVREPPRRSLQLLRSWVEGEQ